ncbi:MAG: tetratricopeptide repeat protein [Oxalobacteraceae bacterium]
MKNFPAIVTLSVVLAFAMPLQAAEGPADQEPLDVLPAVGLSEELMFRYLSAEVAMQRGNAFAAYATMLSIARSTSDPRLARRATEMAMSGSLPAEALKAARVWHDIAPHSDDAAQVLLSLQLQANRVDEAKQSLASMLSRSSPTTLPLAIGNVQRLLSRLPDRARAAALLKELLEPYRDALDARLALAQMAMVSGDRAAAIKELRATLTTFPTSEVAVLMLSQITEDKGESTKTLVDFLKKNPKAREVRLAYSRMLFEQGKLADAKKEFKILLQQSPNDQTALYALGLLSAQVNEMADAEKYLSSYIANLKDQPDRERDATQALMVLAQIAEDRNDEAGTVKWLQMVPVLGQTGAVNATIKRAQLQAKSGKLDEARKLLNEADVNNDDERVKLVIGEAQLLKESGKIGEAIRLLEDALELYKNHIDLLYELAMLAEKNEQFDLMESTLRKVIQLAPDSQHAYNALGYSLADRNLRLPEAYDLIKKALSLAPEDPFIMDSMGWVEFRLGRLEKAEELLKRAFAIKPDPEIAAHLGEVLWVLGREEDAKKLWRKAGGKESKNDTLKSTLKRLQVKL